MTSGLSQEKSYCTWIHQQTVILSEVDREAINAVEGSEVVFLRWW